MRVETKYFAFDETEFETEEECAAYEKKLDELWDSVILLDEEFRTYEDAKMEPLEFAESSAIYVKVLDADKAGELINWIYEYSGISMPPVDMLYTGGVFKFDANAREEWVDLTERLREVTMEMESIEKAVKKLEETE